MTSKIYAPNVHLFAFHLKTSEPTTLLWDKSNEIISQKFGVTKQLEIEEESGYRVDLLKDKTTYDVAFHFGSNVTLDNTALAVTGVATPLRIQDTYGLALNLRRPELEDNQTERTQPVPSSFLEQLNPAGCLMPEEIGSSLGQTLVLTVWYTEQKRWVPWKLLQNRQELRQLADECLRAFIPAQIPCPHFNQEGELFGSPIFEYGVPSQPEKYCHILVWIFWEPEASDKFIDYYSKFINLFCYRNKVIRAYQLNRQVYQVIKDQYQTIEEYFDETFQHWSASRSLSQGKLDNFKEEIKLLSQKALEYSRLLRDLEHYRLTITINAENYQRELRDISSQLPQDDLSFLESFFNDCRLFQEQIQSDLGYFGNGTALLEQALSAIRGRVDIDQAEREKRLQRSIALVGTGLAFSGISSQTAGKPVESIITQLDPKQSLDCPRAGFTSCMFYSVLFVLFHVGVGVIAALIVNEIINLVSKREQGAGNREQGIEKS